MQNTLNYSMIVVVLEVDFEFILIIFHWCQSSTTFLQIEPILFFCRYSCSIDLLSKLVYSSSIWTWKFPHLRLFLRTFSGMYSYFGFGGCPSIQQSGLSLPFVVCLLYDLLSFLFHSRRFIWNQHYVGWKIFCSYFSVSRDMRLWETDLESLLNHT